MTMVNLLNDKPATGGPGIEPRWTRSDKHGIGTACSIDSHVWFTVSKGILNEIYYPTIDRPQVRDLQYLVTDGKTFFHSERKLVSTHERLFPDTLGYRINNVDPDGRYRIEKEVIAAPDQDCVLVRTQVKGDAKILSQLRLFALLAPHLEVGGHGNTANVVDDNGMKILTAHKGETWLALAATIPFTCCSCGYVGTTDGWQDLRRNLHMEYQFDCAIDGNIALTGELDIVQSKDFVLGLAFGKTLDHALNTLHQALAVPFGEQRKQFNSQWRRCNENFPGGETKTTGDGGISIISAAI